MATSNKMVDPNALGSSAPKLMPSDLDGDVAVLTISGYDTSEVDDPEKPTGKRLCAFITFEETGDKRVYLNKTMASVLVKRYGSDSGEWPGEPVVVEVYTPRMGTRSFDPKVGIAPEEEWEKYLEQAGVKPQSRKVTARRSPGKLGKVKSRRRR